jgi:hypothetical protein
MPSGPNAENAKDLYNKSFFHQSPPSFGLDLRLKPGERDWRDPAPRSAKKALKIVGEGDMGANIPMSRKGAPKRMRKGRAK